MTFFFFDCLSGTHTNLLLTNNIVFNFRFILQPCLILTFMTLDWVVKLIIFVLFFYSCYKNYHKLPGLKHKFYILQLCRSKVWNEPSKLKSWFWSGLFLYGACEGKSLSLVFPGSRVTSHSLVHGHLSPSFKANSIRLRLHTTISLVLLILPPSPNYKNLCDYIVSTQMI